MLSHVMPGRLHCGEISAGVLEHCDGPGVSLVLLQTVASLGYALYVYA